MSIFQQGHTKAGKLTLASVAEIRQLYGQGATQGHFCRAFGFSINTIGRIVRGETWSQGAELREPTEEEIKASQLRTIAMMKQLEREKAFEAEHASPPFAGLISPPDGFRDQPLTKQAEMVSAQAKALRDKLLGYGEEPRRAPPSLLDGGDAPAETSGEGLAKLEEAAQAEGLDVEMALRRGEA